jgi:ssDNA-binding replication factor A large subunit
MRILITILLLISTNLVFAEEVYVIIDKKGIVHPGEEAGQNEYGDVVAIHKSYIPTRAEIDRYEIMKVNLTAKEQEELLEPEEKAGEIVRARKRKVDIDKIKKAKKKKKKGKKVDKKTFTDNIIVKPKLK